jgi:hypothetical protein
MFAIPLPQRAWDSGQSSMQSHGGSLSTTLPVARLIPRAAVKAASRMRR